MSDLTHVHVLSIDHDFGKGDYVGYTSAHRTEAGARRKLKKIVEEWGLEDLLEEDKLRYSLGYLPIED